MIQIGDFYGMKQVATEEIVKGIAEVSGDINPVHLDTAYAKGSMFGGKVAHGLFCLNMISAILGNHLPGPGTILIAQDFKYKKPVYIGDEIETKVSVESSVPEKSIYQLRTVCINQHGVIVLEGSSTVKWKKKQLQLSDYMESIGGHLVKDGIFETLEYCTADCADHFLTFLEEEKFLPRLSPQASCVLATEALAGKLPASAEGIVIAEEPKKSFVKLHNALAQDKAAGYGRLRFDTVIGEGCQISPLASIAKQNVRIGNFVTIGDFAVIKENVTIGDCSTIHENCVIGGKSFNFARTKDGQMLGMADLGQVILEDHVEVCSLCHIAGCPLPTDVTRLESGVKLDAMVHVGHGTKIGARTEVPAGAQIAGNCVIGEDAWIGVNATIANRIRIGSRGRVSLGAVVTQDVEDGQIVSGNFAVDHRRFLQELREANERAAKLPGGGGETSQ